MLIASFPGAYALLLHCAQAGRVRVGRLGEMPVQVGYYLYLGSAFGPGGLAGRIAHHLRPPAALRWHIDYLRQAAQVVEIWAAQGRRVMEHTWAQVLCAQPECSIPLARFGASDCRCPAHLVFLRERPTMSWFGHALEEAGCPKIALGWLAGEKGRDR